ncbi:MULTISPECIES: DUF6127 family protein [Kordiimonadales]|uniref:DUF6127 family protein n=1 Tax=Gimibacter soli TaxID=3024400 RepID=A0AAF0BMW5_9PROT|nr:MULTISPECIES: DUF6127 family protein [Kordiimonadales]WCL55096.1 DUF6127 family protein [Gimibacter soli]
MEQSGPFENADGLVVLSPESLEAMLERAATLGARRALEGVGLHDADAGEDVRDLRSMLSDWRHVRAGFMRQLGRVLFWAFIALGAVMSAHSGWFGGK